MAQRLAQLEEAYAELLKLSAARRARLEEARNFHHFMEDYDNEESWLVDKQRICKTGITAKDLRAVLSLQQKHKALEDEIKSRKPKSTQMSEAGKRLINEQHPRSSEITSRMDSLAEHWQALESLEMAQKRHALLEDSIHLFGFYRECDDFEKWMKEKERMVKSEDVDDGVDNAKRKFEKFITDLSAASKRVEQIDGAVDTFRRQGHSQLDKIIARQRQIHQIWQRLNNAKAQREKSLEGASSVELFNRTCDEAKVWMSEKMLQLDTAVITPDLKTVQALQRRHQNLERELAPVEEKVNRVTYLGNSVKNAYPAERDNVNARQQEVQDMWQQVQQRGSELRARIESEVGQQIFNNSAKTLLAWIDSVKDQLNADESARDVETANNLLKKHNDLGEDIKAHDNEFQEVIQLGKQLSDGKPNMAETVQLIERLKAEQDAIHRGWAEKQKWLLQCVELQMFNREADKIDATTKSHEAFLEYNNLGSSLDEVEAILKRHLDFEKSLMAQDKILKGFSDNADKLIANDHYDAKYIGERRKQVLGKRKAVKDRAFERKRLLQASKDYHKFAAEADDLKVWLQDKTKIAGDESYRDLSNLPRKLQKHKAFERELRANEGQLRNVNKDGEALIQAENRVVEVERRVADLNKKWKDLLTLSEDKGRKLEQAASQREHNRAIEDAKKKVEELDSALKSKDVGTDLRSCKDLINKQQILESEITIWDQKVAELVSTGDDMAHEGHFNAKHIEDETKELQQRFKDLRTPTQMRRDKLEESLNFHKFVFELDAEFHWINDHMPAAKSNELGQNLHQAQSLYKKHKKLEAEIKGHQPMINKALQAGQALIALEHPEQQQVAALCAELQQAWQQLDQHCSERSRKLEMSLKAQQYLFDAGEIESWLGERNNALRSTEHGRDRDSAAKLLTKHKTIELELDTYSSIVTEMGHTCAAMISAHHPDSKVLAAKQQLIEQMLKSLHKLASQRQLRLMESLSKHEYFLEADEVQQWIREQEQTASSEDYGQDFEHLQLLQNNSPEIKQNIERVLAAWQGLLAELEQRGRGLEEAQDILEFNNQLDKLAAWIRDKEMMVQASDTGRDLEHCNALMRKLDDVDSDMRVDDQRVRHINQLADKLINQTQTPADTQSVDKRRRDFNHNWRQLQGALNAYRALLSGANEIHVFNRDVDDTAERIAEKALAMSSADTGRDLAAVEALIRREEALERDMSAVKQKIAEHEAAAVELAQKYPERGAQVIERKLQELHKSWAELQSLCTQRQQLLNEAYLIHKFVSDVRELELWVNDMVKKMHATQSPATINDCETQLELHQERKVEIEGREQAFVALKQQGEQLQAQTKQPKQVKQQLQVLSDLHATLLEAWTERARDLTEAHQLQLFKAQLEQVEIWLANKEAFLNNDDLGDSYTAVERLLKKHDAFEKLLDAEHVVALQKFGNSILESEPKDADAIIQQLAYVARRKQKLLDLSAERKARLQQSLQLQEFLRSLYEIDRWLVQKLQVAHDENYREPSNLQSKIQKHQAYDAELLSNSPRVQAVIQEGEQLIKAEHYAKEEIAQQVSLLAGDWSKLKAASQTKKEKLQQAYEALAFNRSVDEFNNWMDEVELQLSSEDYGKDLTTVSNLLKKHERLEVDVAHHNELAEQLKQKDEHYFQAQHFLREEIHERAMAAIKRYNSLHEPLAIRRENLEDSLSLQQFLRDAEDELQWLAEKQLVAGSQDLGSSLLAVQGLQKKHNALEAELTSQEPLIQALLQRGQQMIRDNHFASEQLQYKSELLQQQLAQLKDLTSIRRLRLLDAVESQLFYVEANEADAWMREKRPILTSSDYGRDEMSVQTHQKKLEVLQRELAAFKPSIDKVNKLATGLIERHHFDSANIQEKNGTVNQQHVELLRLAKEREQRLTECKKLFEYLRETAELHEWIGDQMTVTASEDYGEDVEHVEQLMLAFESFVNNLNANEARVEACLERGDRLIQENNPYRSSIKSKRDETKQLWDELKDLVHARQDALAGAKQVHVYDRVADETIGLINEKDASLISEDYGQDLESIQALGRKHQVFESELIAIKEQVDSVLVEAQKLGEIYPDAREHIEVKRDETVESWTDLQQKTQARKGKLTQAEQLQSYFDEYR
ncbi:alpha-Spec, partial [Drosophila busckii]